MKRNALIATLVTLLSSVAWSDPSPFFYQGYLKAGSGAANGLYDFQFSVFLQSGTQVGPTLIFDGQGVNPPPVNVKDGVFTVALDFGDVFGAETRYLDITVKRHDEQNWTHLSPRQALLATPYAYYSRYAAGLECPYTESGNVDDPFAMFRVINTGSGASLVGESNNGSGIKGTGSISGVYGSSTYGAGVLGESSAGLAGQFNGTVYVNGAFSVGELMPSVLANIRGSSALDTARFSSDRGPNASYVHTGPKGDWVIRSAADAGNVVIQDTSGKVGIGTGNPSFKLHVEDVTSGNGALYAKIGDAGIAPPNTAAVTGEGGSGAGIQGISNGGPGVVGASNSDYAGFFIGPVRVTGMLEKSGGGFLIDHPQDPYHMFLWHSFVESPDMKNVYDGVITLGDKGEAWVTLPHYFESLNRDFRYQLTCIGGYAPVYIAKKVQNNRFKIAGGTKGLEVSWQVTGIRKDPWANANRRPDEFPKPPKDNGNLIYPEFFAHPAQATPKQ